jgi:hypothetical protein
MQTAEMGTVVTAQKFMTNTLRVFFRKSLIGMITNNDFYSDTGDIDEKSTKSIRKLNQKFTISTLYSGGWTTYSGSTLTWTVVKEVVSTLVIDQFKSLSDSIPSLSYFKSSAEDPKSSLIEHSGGKLRELVDIYALSFVADAGAGNFVGTSYTTGTVTVTTGTGAVVGVGTTFTAGMVGKPFKASGHSGWYRVATFTSTTAITIEDDSDDETTAYTGGAISGGSSYEIQANTLVALTKTNIAQYLNLCKIALDEQNIPEEDRHMVLPAVAQTSINTAAEFNRDLDKTYDMVVKNGKVVMAYGFIMHYVPSSWVVGNNTSGFKCMFAHKSFLSAGYGFIEPITVILSKDNQVNHGDLYKGLFAYGCKVADERRRAGGQLFATFA